VVTCEIKNNFGTFLVFTCNYKYKTLCIFTQIYESINKSVSLYIPSSQANLAKKTKTTQLLLSYKSLQSAQFTLK